MQCDSLFPILLIAVCRGHTVHAVCESFQLAKDAGFKVSGHMHLSSSVHFFHYQTLSRIYSKCSILGHCDSLGLVDE